MKHIIRLLIALCAFIIVFYVYAIISNASDEDQTTEITQAEENIMDEFDFNELNKSLRELFPDSKLSFKELIAHLMDGDLSWVKDMFWRTMKDQFTYEMNYYKNTLIHLIAIAIISAIFTNFSNAFQNRQISETCFYILYLLLLALCLQSFTIAIQSVEEELQVMTDFIGVLSPAYFVAVAIAVGGSTSIAYYNVVLLMIYLVNLLVITILLPGVRVYIMLQVINYLSEEELFSQFGELIEKIITWSLKGFMTVIIGMNLIQRLLSPAIDSLKRTFLNRSMEAVPAIGDAISGTTEVLLGSAVLLKNCIGIAGGIILFFLILFPMLKLVVFTLMFKLAGAMVQPIADKRISGCMNSMSKGSEMLLKILYSISVLFLLTIVIVASTVRG